MHAAFRQTFAPIPELAARFTAQLRSLDDDELQRPVPGMAWTAHDVGAHVLNVLHRYGRNHQRSATREELAQQNESELRAARITRDEVADGIDASVAFLAAHAGDIPLDQRFPFHLGLEVDAAAGWANLCSELLVHGSDVARATGRTWVFPEADVEGIWRNLLPVAGAWLRPQACVIDEVYEFGFSFGTVTLWIHDGAVTVDDATRAADHRVEVDDAVAFTLAVPWRRELVRAPAAALFLSRFYEM